MYKVIKTNEKAEFGTAYLVRFVKVGDVEAVFKDGCWDVYEVIPEEVDYSWYIYIPILIFAFFYAYYKFYIEH